MTYRKEVKKQDCAAEGFEMTDNATEYIGMGLCAVGSTGGGLQPEFARRGTCRNSLVGECSRSAECVKGKRVRQRKRRQSRETRNVPAGLVYATRELCTSCKANSILTIGADGLWPERATTDRVVTLPDITDTGSSWDGKARSRLNKPRKVML